MKSLKMLSFSGVFMGLMGFLISPVFAQPKTYSTSKQVDVEYNATANSPTLPLQQTPPPQNYPNSVTLGVPSYYYYYYPPVGSYYGGAPYGGASQAGVVFTNTGGRTQRSFWYTTPIPGQVPPPAGGSFYGSGFYNPGNYLFMP